MFNEKIKKLIKLEPVQNNRKDMGWNYGFVMRDHGMEWRTMRIAKLIYLEEEEELIKMKWSSCGRAQEREIRRWKTAMKERQIKPSNRETTEMEKSLRLT